LLNYGTKNKETKTWGGAGLGLEGRGQKTRRRGGKFKKKRKWGKTGWAGKKGGKMKTRRRNWNSLETPRERQGRKGTGPRKSRQLTSERGGALK